MSLARRMARRKAKAATAPRVSLLKEDARIQLQNPVSDHFPSFICGNALQWQMDALADIEAEAPPAVTEDIAAEVSQCKAGFAYAQSIKFQAGLDTFGAGGDRYVVREGEAKGQHIVICGAGPSLVENAEQYCRSGFDQLWGCNSALPWLVEHGYRPTHGVTVDQTPQMVNEWDTLADVEYLVASTIHPFLADHLKAGKVRRRWFHNFVGIKRPQVEWTNEDGKPCRAPYEDWLYLTMFPGTVMAGSGLNTVTRAYDVAKFMGASKITILGADCALRITAPPPDAVFGSPEHKRWLEECTVMHADGGHALAGEQSPLTLGAEIDAGTPDRTIREGHGRYWETKVDLMVSAIWLVMMKRKYPELLEIVGDTLPNALMGKSDDFLRELPNFTDEHGRGILPEIV